MSRVRTWSALAIAVAALGLVAVSATLRGNEAHGQGGAPPAGYKNLQVLPKNISKEQLKSYMKALSKSLDVECDHCHEPPDMAGDQKEPKKVARQMMKMTDEINKKWLKGLKDADKNQVTCNTCHRGTLIPPK